MISEMYRGNGRKKKTLVESMRSINISKAEPEGVLQRVYGHENVTCIFGRYFFMLKHDPRVGDFYLEMERRGPNNTQSTINLIKTKCTYGGSRWWFECPECKGRAAILYDKNDDFFCRRCLELEYLSHQTNYRSITEPTQRRLAKLEQISQGWRPQYYYYRGRLTRRAIQEEKLLEQVEASTKQIQAGLSARLGRPSFPFA